jgi:hypothetical protein
MIELLLASNADPSIETDATPPESAYTIAVESKRLICVGQILEGLALRLNVYQCSFCSV